MGVRYAGEGPKPCAIGAVALAVLNAEPGVVRLHLYPAGMGSPWLLCQTNPLGECIKTATYLGLELDLPGDEVATFSAYFLSFDDASFGRPGEWRAGFDIQEITSSSYSSVRAVATATVPVESPPFEWRARVTKDELNVTGSVWVGNGCAEGILTELLSADPTELRL